MHLPILLFVWLALPSLEAKPLRMERSKIWLLRGIAYAEKGADNQASESFNIAYWIDPSNVEPLWRKARLLFRNSEYGRAIECSNKAIVMNSRCSEAYAIRGLSRVYMGEQEAAIANIDQAIRYESKAEYFGFRGLAHYRLTNYSKAFKDLEQCIKLDPFSRVFKPGKSINILPRYKISRCN